ncbi:MAG: Gfo/Idh/MocA family oxidoreductase [Firmicutes bacterium]|nr:Gfo/Idh/MocA family oxidoreductase [Bacillota bacterium]
MKIGVIGAGNWGINIVRTLARLGALGAVAETRAEVRMRLAEEFPELPLYSDYEGLLAEPKIPAVAIATPAPTHHRVARAALLAGKDVFVEKPMTMTAAEAEELVGLAEEGGRILMVGHLLLYQPAVQFIKDYLDSGSLGRVFGLHQERLGLGRARAVENVLWCLGVHDVAVLLYLLGAAPLRLSITGQRNLQPGIEDDIYLHLEFAGGIQAHLHCSWLWPEKRRRLTIVGEKGMLVYDELEQSVTLHRKGIGPDLRNIDGGSELLFEADREPLLHEMRHFLSCLEDRRPPISDGLSGVAVMRVLEEAGKKLTPCASR